METHSREVGGSPSDQPPEELFAPERLSTTSACGTRRHPGGFPHAAHLQAELSRTEHDDHAPRARTANERLGDLFG
jgi:hypothetical protein